MGVDATSKQTGGNDCGLEGAGLYYHTFIAVDRHVLATLATAAWWWYGSIDFCAGLHDAWLETNLILASYFFFQLRRRSAARTGWVSLRGHLGALLLSTSSQIPRCAHVPVSESRKYFFVDVFFLVVFAYCLSFITTSCPLIVVPSRGLNDSADTSSPISEVSP